ncbi:MAG: c-type cytochrome [Vicinamibacterales bacterium]
MHKRLGVAVFIGSWAIATVFAAAQGGPQGAGESLPSGITALAPSPPAGAPPDPAAVARGTVLYETTLACAPCHGLTGRGGPANAPDLTRSALAVQLDGGRALTAFLRIGRPEKGMPPVTTPLTDQQAADLSAKLRALGFAAVPAPVAGRGAGGRGGGPPLPAALAGQQLSILVGDPKLGKRYFEEPFYQCSSCHSVKDGETRPAANLAHIATKYADPKALQNAMLINRGLNWSPRTNKDVTATITYANGRTVKGYLTSVSDFKVVIQNDDGKETELPRKDDEPKVVLTDRLQYHLDLLARYLDSDMHDLTAYLATLK